MTYTYFIDRSMGKKIFPTRLRQAGIDIEVHDDYFAPDTPDVAWILRVSRQGWVIVTADERIRYNPLEKRAVEATGARLLILKSARADEQAALFVDALAEIERFLQNHSGPVIARITRGKKRVTKVYPP